MSFSTPTVSNSEAFMAAGLRASVDATVGSLGQFSVAPRGEMPSDSARAAAAQLGMAQLFTEADIEGRVPLPQRTMRKRVRGRFVKGGPDEAHPEGSVEQDNRDHGQSTVAIAKKIKKHMEQHGAI